MKVSIKFVFVKQKPKDFVEKVHLFGMFSTLNLIDSCFFTTSFLQKQVYYFSFIHNLKHLGLKPGCLKLTSQRSCN